MFWGMVEDINDSREFNSRSALITSITEMQILTKRYYLLNW